MTNKILVTGATGTIGRALVKRLHQQKAAFVAGVRDREKAIQTLGAETDLVDFDFEKPSTFEAATQGVDRVFLLGPPLVTNLDSLLTPFIDFLRLKGIKHVVYLSALGMEFLKELPFHTIVENKLKRDGFDYTLLKPCFFAQNFKNYEWDNIIQRGILYIAAGAGKVAFVDVYDIAAVAAKVLTEVGHTGKEYEITGPEALSYSDAASILSGLTGKTIVYPHPSAEEYTAALKAAGAPDFIAPYMISVYSLIANNKVNIVSDVVERITGRKAASLRSVLERDFALSMA